jgi:hypothetical protein
MKATRQIKKPDGDSMATARPLKPPSTEEEIRQRAHQIFLARGGAPGRELDDWLLAEYQIFRERIEEFRRQDK